MIVKKRHHLSCGAAAAQAAELIESRRFKRTWAAHTDTGYNTGLVLTTFERFTDGRTLTVHHVYFRL